MFYLDKDKIDCLINLLLKKGVITDSEWREAENDLIQLRFQQSLNECPRGIPGDVDEATWNTMVANMERKGVQYGEDKN